MPRVAASASTTEVITTVVRRGTCRGETGRGGGEERRAEGTDAETGGLAARRARGCGLGSGTAIPTPQSAASETYQSNFAPIRRIRGPMIVVGNKYVAPDAQLIFVAAFEFVML